MDGMPPPEEIAEDYKSSLEDLTVNSRYEISNLTVIAKENIHAAQAIARVLEEHINQVGPPRKLPALYLLDSIVKNIGTPYTLFFGKNLYQIFMNAYALVDNQIRKKLEEMLHTWKQPPVGAPSMAPVFPPEITRRIENALIKARTMAITQQRTAKQQQERIALGGRSTPPNLPYRSSPMPVPGIPALNSLLPDSGQGAYGLPGRNTVRNTYSSSRPVSHFGRHDFQPVVSHTPTPQPQQAFPFNTANLQSLLQGNSASLASSLQAVDSLGTLKSDISSLIETVQKRFSENIHDPEIRMKLSALFELQKIVEREQLAPDQIALIRSQLSSMSISHSTTPPSVPMPSQSVPLPAVTPLAFLQSVSAGGAVSVPATAAAAPPPPPPPIPAALQNLSTASLAELLSATFPQGATLPPPPPPPQGLPISSALLSSMIPAPAAPTLPLGVPPFGSQMPIPPIPSIPQSTGTMPPLPDTASLFENLQKFGLLPPLPPPPPPSSGAVPLPILPFPPRPASTPAAGSAMTWKSIDVELNSNALKRSRPHLIALLYDVRPNQCSNCARRFPQTQEGAKEKAAHLDWHFRVHQRLAESQKRGQNRSWYVDEEEWIKSTEDPEDIIIDDNKGFGGFVSNGNQSADDPKSKYVVVPNNPDKNSLPCPICQEKFETVYHADAEDFVWMDAIEIGDRVYHASCHAEVSKNSEKSSMAAAKKRKAENDFEANLKTKLKKET